LYLTQQDEKQKSGLSIALHIPAVIFSLQNRYFIPTYPVSFSKHFEPLLTFPDDPH